MSDVTLTSARTTESDPDKAAEELLAAAGGSRSKLAILYTTRDRDVRALAAKIRSKLPKETRLLGATTGCAIDNAGFHPNAAVLGVLGGDVDVGIGLGKNIGSDAVNAGAQALERAASELGKREADLDTRRYVAAVIDDGFRSKKEEILLGALEKNPALTLVGGGACDRMPQPQPSAELVVDGDVATDSVAIVLFHTNAPWAALRPHAYVPTGERVVFTKVDDASKRVLEINGKPAAPEYARILGVGVDELEFGKPRGFSLRPTALRVGREYFMRSPWMPLPDGSIVLVSHVTEGTELELMRMGDMVQMTEHFFERELPERVPSPSAALLFHCGGRSWIAHSLGIQSKLGETLKKAPSAVGLDVAGEIYNGFAIDTTMTMLAFGKS